MAVTIIVERPDSAETLALIAERKEHLAPQDPPQRRHSFSPERLTKWASANGSAMALSIIGATIELLKASYYKW